MNPPSRKGIFAVVNLLGLFAALLIPVGCEKSQEVHPLVYVALPLLVGGGQRPETPTDLQYRYYPGPDTLLLEWSASNDPEIPGGAPAYRVYYYRLEPPVTHYQEENLLYESPYTSVSFNASSLEEIFYITVTATDGLAESIPTPYLTVNKNDESRWY